MGSTLRADLAFPVGFLSGFQSKPHVPAEVCLRSFLRWLKGHLHYVQQMPASSPPVLTEEGVVVGFCDASWNVTRRFPLCRLQRQKRSLSRRLAKNL